MWRLVAAVRMGVYGILLNCLISLYSQASAFALGLHDFAIEYKSYDRGGRHALAPGYALTQQITVSFEIAHGVDLTGIGIPLRTHDRLFYWRNAVHGAMESVQFRTVGWAFEFGMRPFPWIEFGRFHHSQHLLDVGYDWPGVGGFPVEDGFFLRLRLAE